MIKPGWITDSVGLAITAAIIVWQTVRVKKRGVSSKLSV